LLPDKESLFLEDNELDLIKPLYTSKEISRYYANKQNKLWVVYTNSKFKDPKPIFSHP
jgi:adenine-specific DNA-methyltransferase